MQAGSRLWFDIHGRSRSRLQGSAGTACCRRATCAGADACAGGGLAACGRATAAYGRSCGAVSQGLTGASALAGLIDGCVLWD